jgi:tetratricopeptide (TPR) repeat protein
MRKLLLLIAGMTTLLSLASAQAPSQERIDAIWDSAMNRIVQQVDIWFDDGEFPIAIQAIRIQYELEPQDYEIATNLGWMLENIEENDKALVVYQDYRQKNPNNPDASFPEAHFYFRKREFEKVPPLLEPAIQNGRPHPNAYRTLAHAYERLEKLQDSARVWQTYIALAPGDETAKKNLERVQKKIADGT